MEAGPDPSTRATASRRGLSLGIGSRAEGSLGDSIRIDVVNLFTQKTISEEWGGKGSYLLI